MRRIILGSLIMIAITSGLAMAQLVGEIEIYADAGGTQCIVQDPGDGVIQVHIYLASVVPIRAIQFAAPKPDCWTNVVYLGEQINSHAPEIGNTQNVTTGGLTMGFDCVNGSPPYYIGYMSFLSQGTPPVCCRYPIVKAADLHPEFGGPIAVPCSEAILVGLDSGAAWINSDGSCNCDDGSPVPTEHTTWGKVKSLYK
jgi:hypothetical protein